MSRNKVKVKIDGVEIQLTGNEPQRYMDELAQYVNDKILAVRRRNYMVGKTIAMILCAVNIADELFKEKRGGADYAGNIAALEDKILELEEKLTVKDKELNEFYLNAKEGKSVNEKSKEKD